MENKDIEFKIKRGILDNSVIHLFRPNGRITGEIRHVDGGYNIMG